VCAIELSVGNLVLVPNLIAVTGFVVTLIGNQVPAAPTVRRQ
jgi:hypothetical protein